jgi:FlaA1/EpsC-like NDP-sugar epimerase
MRRFFMTIPEAVELVLQAAAIGRPGRVMALEMGEPVKVVDLAEDLIRLSGLVPWRDVEITYTGIRPGEKLSEEITSPSEQVERTEHASILCVRSAVPGTEAMAAALSRLAGIADDRIAPEEVRSGLFSVLAELEKTAASRGGQGQA